MDTTKVKKFKEKYLELLKQIDCGEYALSKQGERYDGFEKWVARYIFEDNENYGLLSSFVFNGALRIQIAFKHDVKDSFINIIEKHIREIVEIGGCEDTYVWCTNFNPSLVNTLKDRLPIEKGVYMSSEFTFYKDSIQREFNVSPLIVKPYNEQMLDDILELLEGSFKAIAQRGEFINDRDYFFEKFRPKEKSRCEVYCLDDKLVGFYYYNDAEIEYMAVAEGLQSKGYGSKILKRCLDMALDDSERLPHLNCVYKNHDAYRFYLREGGVVTGKSARFHIINKIDALST